MPTFTPPRTWVQGDGTSAQMNAGVRVPIGELQTEVAKIAVDTDWTDLTLTSPVTVYGRQPQFRTVGGLVQLRGGVTRSTAWTGGPNAIATGALPVPSVWGNTMRVPAGTDTNTACLINPRTSGLQLYTSVSIMAVILDGVQWSAV